METRTGRLTIVADVVEAAGGLEILEHRIARDLANRGWRITLCFRRSGDLIDSWREFASVRAVEHLTASHLDSCDVVYTGSPSEFESVTRAARDAATPAVLHLHLPPTEVREGWRAVKGRVASKVSPDIVGPSSPVMAWVAVSGEIKRLWRLAGVPGEGIRVIHNGVDPSVFRPDAADRAAVRDELGLDEQDIVIGYAGRLDRRKGVDALCSAVGRVQRGRTRVHLVIAGQETRHLRESGSTFADDLRSRHHHQVHWLGQRTDTERLYRGFDLLVVPSRWREPFGLVIIEAMASGVPVVATPKGGIPEILSGEFARWLSKPTPRQLARTIDELIEARSSELANAARAHVTARFSAQRQLDELDALLDDVARSSVPAPVPS